jgi:hypothetical protein
MPRKKAVQAADESAKAQESRWRYLVRNPEFLKSLRALAKYRTPETIHVIERPEELSAFAKKWAVPWSGMLEEAIYALVRNPNADLQSHGAYLLEANPPVSIETERQVFSPDSEHDPDPSFVTGRAVYIRVDLTHPLDTLLPLIERELRQFAKRNDTSLEGEPELRATLAQSTGHRRRLDRVEYYLRVFDLAEQGQTFRTIAKELKRPLSSVKSAFLAARRNIFGLAGSTERASKKALPLETFDVELHFQTCATCQKADSFEKMCPKARLYALQDHKGQTELPASDSALH